MRHGMQIIEFFKMTKLDILFVHPNASKKVYQGLSKDYSAIEPPIWAALLANHSRAKGHSVNILDCEAERQTTQQSVEIIVEYDPKLVVIVVYGQQPSASTQNMEGVRDLCNSLKEEDPSLKILLTGLYPSAAARKTLQLEKADFVCQGEGPLTIDSLIKVDMEDPSQLKKVPGLWYRAFSRGSPRHGMGFASHG